MDQVRILDPEHMGRHFIPAGHLPEGVDEYYLRDRQTVAPAGGWRHLRADEVERLVKNNNTAGSWDDILVSDPFDATLIKNSRFFGLVRLGSLRRVVLQHHDLRLPAGITNSTVIACDVGDDVAIHDVHYLAHYIIGTRNILFNIDEMHTTSHAKFGHGVVKEGEAEQVRVWLEVMNETGARRVLPFNGIIPADAFLWARYADDAALQQRLKAITQSHVDSRRGYYGATGGHCVIKNSRILKDVAIGSHCYIKGANKLKNLTINSSAEERTQIGEGVELVNGIIGYGCRIFYGCKAVRFVLGNNSHLKYGARLINSFLGDNSTISCCEVLNNLIFPFHEQHHNNSFLIAALVMGQSNIAAGATIGSNHNSRANDNELVAGRGFWPGLCTSLKHPSRFASFVLVAKGDYPAELDIVLPFALVSNRVADDCLEVMPAYWWMYNMYALARNAWKFRRRDTRITRVQHIEYDTLAPDTIEECVAARDLLATWTARAYLQQQSHRLPELDAQLAGTQYNPDTIGPAGLKKPGGNTDDPDVVDHFRLQQIGGITDDPDAIGPAGLQKLGTTLLTRHRGLVEQLRVRGQGMENSRRPVIITKAWRAWHAYGDMMLHYAIGNLLDYLEANPGATFDDMCGALAGEREQYWVNMGGQLMRECDVDALRADIGQGRLSTWDAIHARYDALWQQYPLHRQQHAFAVWRLLEGAAQPGRQQWRQALERAMEIQQYICDQVYDTRKKDHDNPFRKAIFRNDAEMEAVAGSIDDNPFISQVRQDTEAFRQKAMRHL